MVRNRAGPSLRLRTPAFPSFLCEDFPGAGSAIVQTGRAATCQKKTPRSPFFMGGPSVLIAPTRGVVVAITNTDLSGELSQGSGLVGPRPGPSRSPSSAPARLWKVAVVALLAGASWPRPFVSRVWRGDANRAVQGYSEGRRFAGMPRFLPAIMYP